MPPYSPKTLIDRRLYDYMNSVSLREPELLRRLRAENVTHPQSSMQISADQGQFFGFLVRAMGAVNALEIGVFTGYSSLSVALALPPEGRLVACDISDEYTRVAREYWREAGVEGKIELRLGPAVKTLEGLLGEGREGTFDFAFIDADKVSYAQYYELCLRLVRRGGVIAVDNVLQDGKVLEETAPNASVAAIRAFNEALYRDERVDLAMLPVADGITLVCRR
jgi:caffeoyl-CoA O-methyltransferase